MFNYDADLQLISSKLWYCCHLKTALSFNLWELLATSMFWEKKSKTPKFVFRGMIQQCQNLKPFRSIDFFFLNNFVLGITGCE